MEILVIFYVSSIMFGFVYIIVFYIDLFDSYFIFDNIVYMMFFCY